MTDPNAFYLDTPCNADWDAMAPAELGRFCDHCQFSVIDFTNFTAAEVRQYYVERPDQKICGRFTDAQIIQPQVAQSRYSKPFRIFAAAFLLAFGLALFSPVVAQRQVFNITTPDSIINEANGRIYLRYFVHANGVPIPHAKVEICASPNHKHHTNYYLTDKKGYFFVQINPFEFQNVDINIIISVEGYEDFEHKIITGSARYTIEVDMATQAMEINPSEPNDLPHSQLKTTKNFSYKNRLTSKISDYRSGIFGYSYARLKSFFLSEETAFNNRIRRSYRSYMGCPRF